MAQLTIDQAQMSFAGGGIDPSRATRISQMAVARVNAALEKEQRHFTTPRDANIARLVVPPIAVSFANASDETIADLCVTAIVRAVMRQA